MFNKGSGFNADERDTFGLHGLLPSHVATIEEQSRRIYQSILRKSDPLEQYIGLCGLQDRNEMLFYRLMLDHLDGVRADRLHADGRTGMRVVQPSFSPSAGHLDYAR
jgi:hypothetical protein